METSQEENSYEPSSSVFVRSTTKLLHEITTVLTCACCHMPAVSWLNVRHLQIVLVSTLLSIGAITSNLRLISLIMTDAYWANGFNWNRFHQMLAHTSYFYGHMVMNLSGIYMVSFVDNKFGIVLTILLASGLSMLTPILLDIGGLTSLLIVRFFVGMAYGVLISTLHVIITRWSTKKERMTCYSLAFSGTHLGHSIMMIVTTVNYQYGLSWRHDFYIIAYYGWLVMALWMMLGAQSPDVCPYLSRAERQYIEKEQGPNPEIDIWDGSLQWSKLLRNKPFLALTACYMCGRVSYWVLLSQIPIYFAEVYDYPIWKAGLITALPHALVWLSCYPVGYTIELFIRADIASTNAARKSCSVLASVVGGIAFMTMAEAKTLLGATTSYTMVVTLGMYSFMGSSINHLDLSMKYSAVLLSLSRGLANLSAIGASLLAVFIVDDLVDQAQWNILFYVTGSINIVGGVIFVIFGSTSEQDYNYQPP